jgi:hypothetical protein
MMSIMTVVFNAHAWIYVRRASLISMPVMQALVKRKNKPSVLVLTMYRLVKKFPMPMPSGLHKWFFFKCPARLV